VNRASRPHMLLWLANCKDSHYASVCAGLLVTKTLQLGNLPHTLDVIIVPPLFVCVHPRLTGSIERQGISDPPQFQSPLRLSHVVTCGDLTSLLQIGHRAQRPSHLSKHVL